jgi:Ca2+-binding EF-hand superfamily protein
MASTTVTVKAAEPWQNYDKDRSGKIETSELITAIQDWLSNKLSTKDLINVIQKWLQS